MTYILQELPEQQRSDAVSSMVYEANARVRDPVYGCVGAISSLQQQIDVLQTQLAIAQAEVVHMKMNHHHFPASASENTSSPVSVKQIMPNNYYNNSQHHYHPHQATKSYFTMDMVVDQANSLWSC